MKIPTCKLCETKHWTWDEHNMSAMDKTRKLGADVLRKEKAAEVALNVYAPAILGKDVPTNVPTPLPDVPTVSLQECECGKPREGRYKKCAACRKAAYRERSRG